MNPEDAIQALEGVIQEIIQLIMQAEAEGNPIPEQLQDEMLGVMTERAQELQSLLTLNQQNNPPIDVEVPISDSAQLLWILSGGQPQAFTSYLREFPDPELNRLIQNPALLASTIQQLQRNSPITRSGQVDGIPEADLQSSNIYGFRFNPRSKKLQVRFQSGSVYEYSDVPDVIFNLFSKGNASARTNGQNEYGRWWRGKNPSLGASLNQYIKAGGYAYRRLR